jgi:hypothetical protein
VGLTYISFIDYPDVSASQYGTVNTVRIPPQGRRMYGFVSFHDPGTAQRILSERTAHFICGDQVHVKAYREKRELL